MIASRDQLTAAATVSRPITTLHLPGLGLDVGMRPLTGAEMATALAMGTTAEGRIDNIRCNRLIAVMSLCDEAGVRLYRPEDADDVFSTWPDADCTDLAMKSKEINRLGGEVRAAARKD